MSRRITALTLVLTLLLLTLPFTASAANTFTDIGNSPYQKEILIWTQNGIMRGMTDTTFEPNTPVIRAMMAAIFARIMGYTDIADNTFEDLDPGRWYYQDMLKANAAGVFQGSDGYINPEQPITRAEAVITFARAFMVPESSHRAYGSEDIPSWAVNIVNGMADGGYLQGLFLDGFNYSEPLTREELVKLMNNMAPNFVQKPGNITEVVQGNVLINTGGVTLKNVAISGDVLIAQGAGQDSVTLDGVKVSGTLQVKGGGNSSVAVKGSSVINKISDYRVGGKVRIDTPPAPVPTAAPIVQNAAINGRISDANTGSAIVNASVILKQNNNTVVASTSTDKNGNYTFSNIATGTYAIYVSANGYNDGSISYFAVSASNINNKNLSLSPLGYTLSGTVVDISNNSIVNASVSIRDSRGNQIGSANTINGSFTIPSVPSGYNYYIVATATGYQNYTSNAFNVLANVGNISIPLSKGTFTVSGYVTDNYGTIDGATVYFRNTNSPSSVADIVVYANRNGAWTLGNVTPGSYRAYAGYNGSFSDDIYITVTNSDYANANMKISAPKPTPTPKPGPVGDDYLYGSVNIYIPGGQKGAPYVNVALMVGNGTYSQATTDQYGNFTLYVKGATPGDYRIVVDSYYDYDDDYTYDFNDQYVKLPNTGGSFNFFGY